MIETELSIEEMDTEHALELPAREELLLGVSASVGAVSVTGPLGISASVGASTVKV